MKKLKVTFDRSAFHGDSFETLKASNLLRASERSRVSVYYTWTFLEETIATLSNPRKRHEIPIQLPFLWKISNGRWFWDIHTLSQKQLLEGQGEKESLFIPGGQRERFAILFDQMAQESSADNPEFDRMITEDYARMGKLYNGLKGIRIDFPRRLKDVGKSPKDIRVSFDEAFQKYSEPFCREAIQRILGRKEDRGGWLQHKERYPYVTQYIKGLFYCQYHAMLEQGAGLDEHAMNDVAQLPYLHGLDIIVSNEKGFMRKVFDALYGKTTKRIVTVNEFVNILAN